MRSPLKDRCPTQCCIWPGRAEPFTNAGKNFIRYSYLVDNFAAYPDTLFAPAPELPPCGSNTKSSRTWVDFFDSTGKETQRFLRTRDRGRSQ